MQYERKKLNMKTNKLSLILYLIGGLVVFVPISIVLITVLYLTKYTLLMIELQKKRHFNI